MMSTGGEVTLNARSGRNPYPGKPRMRMFLLSIRTIPTPLLRSLNSVSTMSDTSQSIGCMPLSFDRERGAFLVGTC